MSALLDPDERYSVQTTQVPGLSLRVPAPVAATVRSDALDVTLRIHGAEHGLTLDPRTRLLDALGSISKSCSERKALRITPCSRKIGLVWTALERGGESLGGAEHA